MLDQIIYRIETKLKFYNKIKKFYIITDTKRKLKEKKFK